MLHKGLYCHSCKRAGFQQDHTEGNGFDSRSPVQEFFVKQVSLISLDSILVPATCKMIIGRGSFQLMTVEALSQAKRQTLSQLSQFVLVSFLDKNTMYIHRIQTYSINPRN